MTSPLSYIVLKLFALFGFLSLSRPFSPFCPISLSVTFPLWNSAVPRKNQVWHIYSILDLGKESNCWVPSELERAPHGEGVLDTEVFPDYCYFIFSFMQLFSYSLENQFTTSVINVVTETQWDLVPFLTNRLSFHPSVCSLIWPWKALSKFVEPFRVSTDLNHPPQGLAGASWHFTTFYPKVVTWVSI